MAFSLFSGKKKKPAPQTYKGTPAIRCSICTGEQVACMQEKSTGQLHEVMLIRNAADLEVFCTACGVDAGTVRKVY